MDNGARYIDMCGEAIEIQKIWQPSHGDFFIGQTGKIECWISRIHNKKEIRCGFRINRDNDLIHLTKIIWLPRLDQLIELAQVKGRRYENTTQNFFRWAKTPYKVLEGLPQKLFSSLEQMWLAFVMHQKFLKKWDGNSWQSIVRI
jgi:hypothetical protein